LDIDVQGVKSVKQTDLNPWYVFIMPPSLSVLEHRLRSRGTETEDAIVKVSVSISFDNYTIFMSTFKTYLMDCGACSLECDWYVC